MSTNHTPIMMDGQSINVGLRGSIQSIKNRFVEKWGLSRAEEAVCIAAYQVDRHCDRRPNLLVDFIAICPDKTVGWSSQSGRM